MIEARDATASTMEREPWRIFLGFLLALVALNAFIGGLYAILGATGVPVEWLAGSPFDDYTIPGWILFVVVGGFGLVASLAVLTRRSRWRVFAGLDAAILAIWIAVQLAIVGYVSWLQPAVAVAAIAVGALALAAPRGQGVASGKPPTRCGT